MHTHAQNTHACRAEGFTLSSIQSGPDPASYGPPVTDQHGPENNYKCQHWRQRRGGAVSHLCSAAFRHQILHIMSYQKHWHLLKKKTKLGPILTANFRVNMQKSSAMSDTHTEQSLCRVCQEEKTKSSINTVNERIFHNCLPLHHNLPNRRMWGRHLSLWS